MICIYKITNKINGLIYIGKTKNFKRRYKEYKYGSRSINKHKNFRFMNEMNKFGFDNFEFTILEKCDNEISLNFKEVYWIDKLNSRDPLVGYNSKTGGVGGELNEYSKEKMSISSKSFRHTEEEKLKRSKEIVVINTLGNEINHYKSSKEFSEFLQISRSEATKSLRTGVLRKGFYIFYSDLELRELTLQTIINRKQNQNSKSKKSLIKYLEYYNYVFNDKSVETIQNRVINSIVE